MRIIDFFALLYTIFVSVSTIILYLWGVNDLPTYVAIYTSIYLILYSLLPPMPKQAEDASRLLSNIFLAILAVIVVYKVLVALKAIPGA